MPFFFTKSYCSVECQVFISVILLDQCKAVWETRPPNGSRAGLPIEESWIEAQASNVVFSWLVFPRWCSSLFSSPISLISNGYCEEKLRLDYNWEWKGWYPKEVNTWKGAGILRFQINLAKSWKVLFYLVKRKTIFVILIKLEALANLPKR